MATYTTNFSSWSEFENLLIATQSYESSYAYTSLENTATNLTTQLFSITPSSYTSTSATAYAGGMTANYYGTGFGTASQVITSANITDGANTLAVTGSISISGQYYVGVITSIDFNGQGYSEHGVGQLPLDGSPAVFTSWSSTNPTSLGNVSFASTGIETIYSATSATASFSTTVVSDDFGHSLSISGLNYSFSGDPSAPINYIDTLHGMLSGNDVANGSSGNDELQAFAGDDTLNGGAGNDTLVGGAGNDIIDGGIGFDEAVFSGDSAAYTVTQNSDGSVTVSGLDGSDTLTNIENLVFAGNSGTAADDYTATGAINATPANTGNLAIGGTVSGAIEVAGDYDFFRVQLVAGIAYQFDLKGSSSGAGNLDDPTLIIHNAQNTALRYDDDGGSSHSNSFSTDAQIVFIPQESGTYYLNAGGFASASGAYQLSATTLPSDYYIQGVLDQPNTRWNGLALLGAPIDVTYSFPTSLPAEYASYGVSNFQPFTADQQNAARFALADISHYANITFSEVADAGGQIRFATTDQGSASTGVTFPYAFMGVLTRGDIALSNSDPSNTFPTVGTDGYDTLVHEIGHALGLKHPGDYNAGGGGASPPYLPTSQDASQFTIESYTGNAIDKTPMVFDVAALQYLYGANTTTHAGNDSYTFSIDSIYTIWDVAGNDTLDASAWTTSVTMDLNPGTVSYAGYVGAADATLIPCVAIAFNCAIENATGGSGSDKLLGNIGDNILMGGAGSDRLDSGAGNDTLNGGSGIDTMIGSLGNDTYEVDVADDVITEVSGEGTDQVNVAFTVGGAYTLGANLENATVTGGATIPVNLTGNTGNNALTGNAAANALVGGDGNDTLDGGTGADILEGGSGDDALIGGADADTANFSGNWTQYTLTATTAGWILNGADGADTLMGIEFAHFFDQTISLGNFSPTGSVTIADPPIQGQILTAFNTIADVDGLGAISYQWQADGIAITGATGNTYTLTQAEVGKAISVVASYTDLHGTAESVTSSSTANVYIPPTSKYFVTQSPGSNLLDFDLAYGTLSLQGQNIAFTGTNGIDNVTVAPGVAFDFTKSNSGIDNTHLTGNLADYTTAYTASTVTLMRGAGASAETVLLAKGTSANYDTVAFADGAASTFALHGWASGGALPTLSAAPALPATLNATVKGFALDATGETFTGTSPGINFIATGGNGVDIIYVKAGATVDASKLNSGEDKIYLAGNWADYTKVATSSKITFTNAANGETVIVAAATGASNDRLVFADGYVLSNDAKAALLNDPGTAMTTITGYSTTEVTPLGTGDIVAGTTGADTLNGTAAGDTLYGNGGADTINGGAGDDTIVISDTGTTAASSATIVFTSTANGADTVIGFGAAATGVGGDVLDLSAIANMADSVATGQTLATDFAANNVFIFDGTPITIADAASAIANDASVLTTDGYIVIADQANGNAVTAYHSTDLAGNGTETALVILSGVNINNLMAGNILV